MPQLQKQPLSPPDPFSHRQNGEFVEPAVKGKPACPDDPVPDQLPFHPLHPAGRYAVARKPVPSVGVFQELIQRRRHGESLSFAVLHIVFGADDHSAPLRHDPSQRRIVFQHRLHMDPPLSASMRVCVSPHHGSSGMRMPSHSVTLHCPKGF